MGAIATVFKGDTKMRVSQNPKWIKRLKPEKQAKLIAAYKEFSEREFSQVILRDLACYCHFNQTSFIPGATEYTAFNEGARDVFLHILEMMNMKPQGMMDKGEFYNE